VQGETGKGKSGKKGEVSELCQLGVYFQVERNRFRNLTREKAPFFRAYRQPTRRGEKVSWAVWRFAH